jgi:hypothetical protein
MRRRGNQYERDMDRLQMSTIHLTIGRIMPPGHRKKLDPRSKRFEVRFAIRLRAMLDERAGAGFLCVGAFIPSPAFFLLVAG